MPYPAILGLYWGATWTLLVASFGAALLANGLDRARRACRRGSTVACTLRRRSSSSATATSYGSPSSTAAPTTTPPMHLHGHTALVLARNGQPTTGSPWWADTLNVAPGETYDIAFRADNPGIWMDHCHNLEHAAAGMTTHVAYEGVHTPFRAGKATGNTPE